MEKMFKIVGTLGASVDFEVMTRDAQGNIVTTRRIHINGGTGIFDSKHNYLKGATATWVTEAELRELEKHPSFKRMVAANHLLVIGNESKARNVDIEKVADENLQPKDNSAQWTKEKTKDLEVIDKQGEIIAREKEVEPKPIAIDAPKPRKVLKPSSTKKSKK